MKISSRSLLSVLVLLLVGSTAKAQNIYQFSPLPSFGSHGDGTIRPGDRSFLGPNNSDTAGFNQRGLGCDPTTTNLVLVDAQTGSGGSQVVKGHIYVLGGENGFPLDDGFGGD